MQQFLIPSFHHPKQTIVLSEWVLTVLDKPQGIAINQWKLDELVDIAFFPASREIGGKKVDEPRGEVRLARTWEERRKGVLDSLDYGVKFNSRGEEEAYILFNLLIAHENVKLQAPKHLAQVETDRFVLTLTDRELLVTYRYYAFGFKQNLDTGLTRSVIDGEVKMDLASISGFKVTAALNDKISMGKLNGTLTFFTTAIGAIDSVLGGTRNDLELDFGKKAESAVREFLVRLDEQLEILRNRDTRNTEISNKQPLSIELKRLADMHKSGLLSDEEFSAAKLRVIWEPKNN